MIFARDDMWMDKYLLRYILLRQAVGRSACRTRGQLYTTLHYATKSSSVVVISFFCIQVVLAF